MKILQVGAYRCGNYWIWKILQETLAAVGHPRHSFIERQPLHAVARSWELSFPEQADVDYLDIEGTETFYTIRPMFRRKVPDLDAYVAAATHVWSHCATPQQSSDVIRRFDKVVYVVRDVRDSLLSELRYQRTPFRQREYAAEPVLDDPLTALCQGEIPGAWRVHVARWLSYGAEAPVHFVFYERLLASFETEYQRLLEHLELELTPEQIGLVSRRVSFKSMKERGGSHLHRGQAEQWRRELTKAQQAIMRRRCGDLLGLLGYALKAEGAPSTPRVPVDPPRDLLALMSEGRSFEPTVPEVAPGLVLTLADPELGYRLDRRADDDEDCVLLFTRGLELTLPGDAFTFVVRMGRQKRFTMEEATTWLGDGYSWESVREVLTFLIEQSVLAPEDA